MKGNQLLTEISQATGLDAEPVERELIRLLNAEGIAKDNVTLDQLREVLSEYLQEVLLEAKLSQE